MMVNDDLQCEIIQFSKRTKAYGTKPEALKNHAKRGLKNFAQLGQKYQEPYHIRKRNAEENSKT